MATIEVPAVAVVEIAGVEQVETATIVGTILGGVAQVETATVAGTITAVTGGGNATVIVTAAGMTGSPKTFSVAVLASDTASVVAGKIRTALAADAAVTALFAVSGSTTHIILTALAAAANDATLNIDIDNGTCTGLTAAHTSADTTAGVNNGGNAAVIVTGAVLAGTPVTYSVPVAAGDVAATIAAKIRAYLLTQAAVIASYVVGGDGAKVVLTTLVGKANDGTLNIDVANGTCSGITTAHTSANTVAGVAANPAS